jgi:DNA-binding NarL/FixJ family response regulator
MTTVELSDREMEVVKQIAQGKTYKEIAEELGLTFETVKTYAARIRRKLQVTSKIKIALWAIENGVVDGRNEPAA